MTMQTKRTKIKLFDPMQNRTFREIVESKSKKWDSLFDSALELSSFSIFDDITNPDQACVEGSFAYNQGFKLLEEFITSSHERGGLFLDWQTWINMVQAARLQKEYGLPSASAEEMVEQYSHIQQMIGRKPKSSLEYVEALSEMQRQKMEEVRIKSDERVEAIRTELKETFSELEKSRSYNAQLENQLEAQRKELNQIKSDFELEVLSIEGRHTKAIELIKEEMSAESMESITQSLKQHEEAMKAAESKFNDALYNQSQDFIAEIDSLKSKNSLLAKDLSSYRDKIRNGSLVDSESYNNALSEIKTLETKISDEVEKNKSVNSDLEFYKQRNEDLKSKITDLEILLKGLKGNIKSLENGEFNTDNYVEREKFEKYADYLEKAKDKYSKLSEKYKNLQTKFSSHEESHKELLGDLSAKNKALSNKVKAQSEIIAELEDSSERFALYVKLAAAIIVVGSLSILSFL